MEYRLYVETVPADNAIGWAFLFYNHQDFNVYKYCGKSESIDAQAVILDTTARALNYFSNFMRRRYYDEHFATILDEDHVTVYTRLPALAELWRAKSRTRDLPAEHRALWEALVPFLTRPTMSFADPTASDAVFFDAAKAMAQSGLAK